MKYEPMTVVASHRAEHQITHQSVLREGLQSHGVEVQLTHSYLNVRTRAVACWGWRVGEQLHRKGHRVLVMERGYVGDRFAWTSLAFNGLNGRATFPEAPQDETRFAEHHASVYQPWRTGGDFCLVIGQVPGDASLQGRNLYGGWYASTAQECARRYGLPAYFRPHPLAGDRGGPSTIRGVETLGGPLAAALEGAALVVTWNSNTGVDAMLAGRPTVVSDPGGMAYPVALHELPDRLDVPEPAGRWEWACRMAWRQWQLGEIRSGAAVAPLLPLLAAV